jgi:hypothetical protein
MSKHRRLSNLVEFTPNIHLPRDTLAVSDDAAGPESEDGAFRAGLFYIAADLTELARTAPAEKSQPLLALVRLVRAMADG